MDELQNIQSKIYVIRGQRVMLDSDIMLSSVLESDTAIEANRRIMRAFVTFHHIKSLPTADAYNELKQEIDNVRNEMNDILADQNDINESTRAQLDAISTALAELQAKPSETKPRKPIGFIQPKDDDGKK